MYVAQVAAQNEHEVEFEFTPMDPRDFPEPEPHDEDIMPLATGNFEREIKKAFMILVFFWKENCDKEELSSRIHCQSSDNLMYIPGALNASVKSRSGPVQEAAAGVRQGGDGDDQGEHRHTRHLRQHQLRQ